MRSKRSSYASARRLPWLLFSAALICCVLLVVIFFGWPLLLQRGGPSGEEGGEGEERVRRRKSTTAVDGEAAPTKLEDDSHDAEKKDDNSVSVPKQDGIGAVSTSKSSKFQPRLLPALLVKVLSSPVAQRGGANVAMNDGADDDSKPLLTLPTEGRPLVHSKWSQQAASAQFAIKLFASCQRLNNKCAASPSYLEFRHRIESNLSRNSVYDFLTRDLVAESAANGDSFKNIDDSASHKGAFFCRDDFQRLSEAVKAKDGADGSSRFALSYPLRLLSSSLSSSLSDGESKMLARAENHNDAEGKSTFEASLNRLPSTVPLILCAIGSRFNGPGGQSYIVHAIKQWRLFHPRHEGHAIHLVIQRSVAEGNAEMAALIREEEEASKEGLSSRKLSRETFKLHDPALIETDAWKAYLSVFYIQGYMHPGGSRKTGNKNFNQHVSERFFAIEAVMRRERLEHAIHMENDMLIYDSLLPTVAAAIACGHSLATTAIDKKGVIPSVLYIRSADAMRHFNVYLNEFLSCGEEFGRMIEKGYANDMTYLMNYYHLYGSQRLGLLPSWEHAEGESCVFEVMKGLVRANRKKQQKEKDSALSDFTASADMAASLSHPSLFDVASFGQWNSFAVNRSKTRPPKHIRNAMKGRYVDATPPEPVLWGLTPAFNPRGGVVDAGDGGGDKNALLFLTPSWKQYKLLSLHIHAKNLHAFRSDSEGHYARKNVKVDGGKGSLEEVFASGGGGD